jgi:hypothetical protein
MDEQTRWCISFNPKVDNCSKGNDRTHEKQDTALHKEMKLNAEMKGVAQK